MTQSIRTAVFPVAGRGTRFLPATKATPKELLPIVDKPLIQYAVEEALQAGAENLVFITSGAKRAIEDHFDIDPDLELELERTGKQELLECVKGILPAKAQCIFIRQGRPLGLGHAVLCARPVAGQEPFYVHLPDDLIDSEVPCLQQMGEVFSRTESSIVAVENVPAEQTGRYGIVDVPSLDDGVGAINVIVEKPAPEEAPSTLAVVGRYILTPRIFAMLEATGQGAGGEIQLTDAIARLLTREPVYACEFSGRRFDCGSKLGYLQATVEYALDDATVGKTFADHLAALVKKGRGRKAGA